MPGRFGTIFSLLAVFVMIDGNWAVLQTVAWARMIESDLSNGASQSNLPRKVAETFSGQRVCSMCVAIMEQRTSEKNEDRGVESRYGGIQIGPIAFKPVSVTPPVAGRTAFRMCTEIFSSVILTEIEPPPRDGRLFS